ncbi:hypothetical protein BDW62DRAFT_30203 [Aspergillus aurantiobrunneus]
MRKEPSTLGKGLVWPEVWRRRFLTISPLEFAASLLFLSPNFGFESRSVQSSLPQKQTPNFLGVFNLGDLVDTNQSAARPLTQSSHGRGSQRARRQGNGITMTAIIEQMMDLSFHGTIISLHSVEAHERPSSKLIEEPFRLPRWLYPPEHAFHPLPWFSQGWVRFFQSSQTILSILSNNLVGRLDPVVGLT